MRLKLYPYIHFIIKDSSAQEAVKPVSKFQTSILFPVKCFLAVTEPKLFPEWTNID